MLYVPHLRVFFGDSSDVYEWEIPIYFFICCAVTNIYIEIFISIDICFFISTPEGRKAARPKDGLFRLHASWIYLSFAGFDCLAAILCH